MTDKKEQIILTALQLFADEGYKGVPTSKIAKQAGVSEGLIFRHFTNKNGLLEAIMEMAAEKTKVLFEAILTEQNPKKVIEKTILLPYSIKEEEINFWKLQFKLKWELELSATDKMKPLVDKLSWAFEALEYKEPDSEAETLNHIIDSIAGSILRDGFERKKGLKEFLLKKYAIQ